MLRWTGTTRSLLAAGCVLIHAASASAVTNDSGWSPVDQAVSDLDPLATGLRRVQAGIGLQGQQSGLFAPNTVQPWLSPVRLTLVERNPVPLYLRIDPGVRATFPRLDYLVRTADGDRALNIAPAVDGQFHELLPPGTVFDLSPTPIGQLPAVFAGFMSPVVSPGPGAVSAPVLDAHVEGRIEGRIDGRIDGRVKR